MMESSQINMIRPHPDSLLLSLSFYLVFNIINVLACLLFKLFSAFTNSQFVHYNNKKCTLQYFVIFKRVVLSVVVFFDRESFSSSCVVCVGGIFNFLHLINHNYKLILMSLVSRCILTLPKGGKSQRETALLRLNGIHSYR